MLSGGNAEEKANQSKLGGAKKKNPGKLGEQFN